MYREVRRGHAASHDRRSRFIHFRRRYSLLAHATARIYLPFIDIHIAEDIKHLSLQVCALHFDEVFSPPIFCRHFHFSRREEAAAGQSLDRLTR